MLQYSQIEILDFSPVNLKSNNQKSHLNVFSGETQLFFEADNYIDSARREFLDTTITDLATTSIYSKKSGLVARFFIGFREPYTWELEADRDILGQGISQKPDSPYDCASTEYSFFPKDPISVNRVSSIKAIVQTFDGKLPKDLHDICRNLNFQPEIGSLLVPQPYEIFFANGGLVKYAMFSNPDSYSPKILNNILKWYLVLGEKGTSKMSLRGFTLPGLFNPYISQ